MKRLLLLSCTLAITGCASKLAANDCENLGYTPGTSEFTSCAERQLTARREAKMEKQRQDTQVAVEKEKASHGIFGRNPGCKTSTYGSGVGTTDCK